MTNVSYVRTEMLPEREPPVSERGVIKWSGGAPQMLKSRNCPHTASRRIAE